MKSKFVHLHTHSHYSLLDGLPKIEELVDEAVRLEMPALALTDHGNLYGAIEFYKECKKSGINPIIGVEAYIAYESLYQRRPNIDDERYHLTLLAQNETGYKNLIQLVTISFLDGFYYKPRMDKELLAKYAKGLIALSGCFAGEISRAAAIKDFERAERVASEYREIFGKENFFIETGYHPNIENYQKIQVELAELAKKLKIPIVATQDVHYIKKEDKDVQDTLVAIQTNAKMAEEDRLTMKHEDFSMRSDEEMEKLFKDLPEAIENTILIAGRCKTEIELGKWVFPKVDLPKNKTAEEHLKDLTLAGYKEKFTDGQELKERMKYELEVINNKGYAPYFLVISDLLNWAHKQGIITTTRGSAAGSLVSYLIGITNIDPIKFALPFERFLNPFRPSPPDIDMDIADDRREEIIEYAKEKYGQDKVAQIGTFGTIMARAAIRDVTRVLDHPYDFGDKISKLIPMGSQGFPMSIERAMKIVPELKKMYEEDEEVKKSIDLAQKLEGRARHVSVHAAGVVISPTKLTDFVPLQREPNGEKIITQYDMYSVDPDYGGIGLLKMDFLGIKNLAILGNSVKLVKKIQNIDIDLENLPFDDEKTFDLLARGETIGVFQLGGSGMTRYLKELKPTCITDIMAMIALYRPGPIANIPTYIRRKNGEEKITYLDPRLEKILKNTYGVITYQDDVLLIAIELAGYDWNTVDKFRKAIGKKIPAEMAKQEKIFIEGCQKFSGLTPEKAEELWKLFDPFKGYGFNKAHAASYAKVAYQTAYMKANFPAEFMTAVLTADAGDTEKISVSINECKRMKIPVLPPDINESFGDFTVVDIDTKVKPLPNKGLTFVEEKGIRFGLYTIKNLGIEIADAIIKERKDKGRFKSFSDFLERIQHKNLNKKSLEALIKAGAMDDFGERNQLFFNIEEALDYNRESVKLKQGQTSLFSLMVDNSTVPELKLKTATPAKPQERLSWEKELLGLYVSGHPLDKCKDKMEKIRTKISGAKKMQDSAPLVTAGVIEEARRVLTKKNESMLFVKISDYTDTIEVVIFPRVLEKYGDIVREGACVAVRGRVSLRNGEPSIICEEIKEM